MYDNNALDDLEDLSSNISTPKYSNYDLESAASMDAESDSFLHLAKYSNYGASLKLEDLTDEQRSLYDNAYHSAYDAGATFDDSDDDIFNNDEF